MSEYSKVHRLSGADEDQLGGPGLLRRIAMTVVIGLSALVVILFVAASVTWYTAYRQGLEDGSGVTVAEPGVGAEMAMPAAPALPVSPAAPASPVPPAAPALGGQTVIPATVVAPEELDAESEAARTVEPPVLSRPAPLANSDAQVDNTPAVDPKDAVQDTEKAAQPKTDETKNADEPAPAAPVEEL